MKKFLAVMFLIAPTLLFGQSALEGTWRTNMDQSKLSQKTLRFLHCRWYVRVLYLRPKRRIEIAIAPGEFENLLACSII